jgi:probable phosphoglycerate mutase
MTDRSSPAGQPTPEPIERQLWLARHGETEWSSLGRHTGRTDIPLTDTGRAQAVRLGEQLRGGSFALVLTSPLHRAAETARLAGFGDAVVDPDLQEWDYGDFEGRRTSDIREAYPDWTIWRGPWPGAETLDEVAARADRVIARVRSVDGDVLVFAHGHLLRILAARWLGLPPSAGGLFALSTATLSLLGWERGSPVIERWNEACATSAG